MLYDIFGNIIVFLGCIAIILLLILVISSMIYTIVDMTIEFIKRIID